MLIIGGDIAEAILDVRNERTPSDYAIFKYKKGRDELEVKVIEAGKFDEMVRIQA